MKTTNKSSRRIFLEKIAAASAGVALSATVGEKIYAAQKSPVINPFASDKKFVPVMVTPYKQNGSIDYDCLSRLVDFYRAAGVKGFFANCASSEMYSLSPEERLSLGRHVVKQVNGAMSVVATGSFGDTLEQKADFTKQMYHTGVNAVILITSHFAKKEESDDVLIANLDKFLSITDNIPLGTYECPSPYKRIITPYVFKYMLGTNRFIYHKDTTIDLDKVKEKIAMIGNNRLEFYDACVANTMYSLQAGAKGMSAICGNFYPEILVWMCNNSTNPDRQEDVKWMQAQLTKTEDIVGQNYPLSAKYFLHKRGLPIEVTSRVNPNPLTAAQKLALDDTYKVFLGWCDRLGIRPAKA
ncbi:dihydrodipicolinate synthase family protein [Flavihumibacter profundi]|jgi:4-hydroxy-tetrahydrodipicolinate synthase|uniref:dihydrodipicolinate synthase family protein n=1 Tax=Flavihumibacter profundi TaxID=2716883 RepID=UPI001CC74488|nr:dihydrodipicolinate synthase family protein [Flavihumibacter profundi]MBZ5856018.1 dihydrodipicolinate synthase family protein [Flavihumibacter profundi]